MSSLFEFTDILLSVTSDLSDVNGHLFNIIFYFSSDTGDFLSDRRNSLNDKGDLINVIIRSLNVTGSFSPVTGHFSNNDFYIGTKNSQ